MCIQCAAGAMSAVAASSGSKLWLEARLPALFGARAKTALRGGLVTAGVLVAGVAGPSAGRGAATATAGERAPAGPGLVATAGAGPRQSR